MEVNDIMKYRLLDREIDVIVKRKNNRNTYIRVKEDMKIYITTNYFVLNKDIKKLLDENKDYIVKMIKKQEEKKKKENEFYYLGNNYNIIFMDIKNVEIYDNNIYVKDIATLNKWYNREIKRIFKEHLDEIYNSYIENIPYPNLKIRKMKTRWGVCNRKTKTITLNSDLIKYSLDKLDYVIVHELSHFIYFDHSANFWNQVSKYCSNYKMIRKDLRD